MSGKHVAKDQPTSFEFNTTNQKRIEEILKKYPPERKKSAVMPLLDLAQRQHNNWIPNAAIKKIGEILGVPYIKVYEVATFYTMYNLAPVGKYFVQVCTTSPCMIRGSGKIVNLCKKYISEKEGKLSEDKNSSWIEVECLGACVSAPMMQINDDFYEDLTEETATKIFEGIKNDKLPKPGSQKGRIGFEPNKRLTLVKN
ncbi:MAG: NADH-quinone oxidoreductase subunit NuoE [Candidatus Fonsibacter lacus]|jgi:NADH-quinone oxidoreductase E subunit|uniref:NADH-quinone oxidoreductase subunit NuoE n=1 Tax=Candidatus Fonsibacter lacus TaxID=2576439 RepID=A0A966HTN7_9PROT|nr:NADH-quinone oxidoreductase subunit NuoE [Candidatus Fonsibacter lacus]NCU74226.1 NADH-quinone oxidoreductase subunit NuoE [Candidatus Fonsibacter lacus]NDE64674.1 NADH-quinone oxidoreductase subunit NuoE [Pseudomonadota bacterium]